jgi:LysR family transcriptional regulator for bpeEF and oprC
MQNRHLSPKVRAFVDWVADLFGKCPMLGGAANEGHACSAGAKAGYNTLRTEIERQNAEEQASILG